MWKMAGTDGNYLSLSGDRKKKRGLPSPSLYQCEVGANYVSRRHLDVLVIGMLLHKLWWDSKGAPFQGEQALEDVFVWRFPLPPVFSQSWCFFLKSLVA